ncbi:MAG: flagellar motor protein MotD [Sulfuricellaceae bacterium]|jgi:chemotaxis protein MotB
MARRKKHEEHENLERWLVSYADFITLMFAFFVVMYSLSSLNEGKYKVLSESLLHAFQNPSSLIIQKPEMAAGHKVVTPPQVAVIPKPMTAANVRIKEQEKRLKGIAEDVMKVMDPLVKEGQVKITQSERGIAIEINASVLFPSGEAKLTPDSVKVLTAVGQVLTSVDNPVQVEGYTDNIPIKSPLFPSNWELSAARASSVVRLFVENGVDSARLVAVGYGENHPVESNDTPEGRARNRRVAVMILNKEQEKVSDVPVVSGPSGNVPGTPPPLAPPNGAGR